VDLNGVGGWLKFRTFNVPYPLESCTFNMYGKMSVMLCNCKTMKCLKLMEF
jgi:hypothetical protein